MINKSKLNKLNRNNNEGVKEENTMRKSPKSIIKKPVIEEPIEEVMETETMEENNEKEIKKTTKSSNKPKKPLKKKVVEEVIEDDDDDEVNLEDVNEDDEDNADSIEDVNEDDEDNIEDVNEDDDDNIEDVNEDNADSIEDVNEDDEDNNNNEESIIDDNDDEDNEDDEEEDDDEEIIYDKINEIKKGTRMCVPMGDFTKKTSINNNTFYKNLYKELVEISGYDIEIPVYGKEENILGFASKIYMAVQKACLKTMVSDNNYVPFLNARISGKKKEGRVFDVIPGGPAKRATYQPPMITFNITTNNYLPDVGLIYTNKSISEASAGGSKIDDTTFKVEVNSGLWKKGDCINIATGKKKKLKSTTNKNTNTKKIKK